VSAVVSRDSRSAATEKGQQRTWDHIPKRNCMWDSQTNKKPQKSFVLWKCEALARRPINPPTVSFLFTIIHISSSAGAWAFLLLALFGEGAQD